MLATSLRVIVASTTDSRQRHKIAENWLAKVPAPDRPGQLWQSDITSSRPSRGGFTWPLLWMPVRGAASHTIATWLLS